MIIINGKEAAFDAATRDGDDGKSWGIYMR